MHLCIGQPDRFRPREAFWARSPDSSRWDNVNRRLDEILQARRWPEMKYEDNVAIVAMGTHGAYVVVFEGGDLVWNLKSRYNELNAYLEKLTPSQGRGLAVCVYVIFLLLLKRSSMLTLI